MLHLASVDRSTWFCQFLTNPSRKQWTYWQVVWRISASCCCVLQRVSVMDISVIQDRRKTVCFRQSLVLLLLSVHASIIWQGSVFTKYILLMLLLLLITDWKMFLGWLIQKVQQWMRSWCFLGRLLQVDLIKWVLNVRPPVRMFVCPSKTFLQFRWGLE